MAGRRLIDITDEELLDMIEERIGVAKTPLPERALDQSGIAAALDISIPTLKKLINEGMPYMPAGDHKRFDRQRVFEWLHARAAATPPSSDDGG